MKEAFNPYLYKITIFTLILLVASILLSRFASGNIFLPILPLIVVFFYIVNTTIHFIIVRATLKKLKLFYNYFMLSTLGKLMLYMVIILIYFFTAVKGKAAFTVSFFAVYILYSGFEVVTLSTYIKKISQKNS